MLCSIRSCLSRFPIDFERSLIRSGHKATHSKFQSKLTSSTVSLSQQRKNQVSIRNFSVVSSTSENQNKIEPKNPVSCSNMSSYDWLESILDDKCLEFAKKHNEKTLKTLVAEKKVEDTECYQRILKVFDSKEKIPHCRKIGDWFYNFWQDDKHVRGIWRRLPAATFFEEYKKPDGANWQTVIDIDKLGKDENQSWVWHGYSLLEPDLDRILVRLSPGGTDADVVREFSLEKLDFLADSKQPFTVPEAKTRVAWKDRDTLYVGTKFTTVEKDGLTDSGYPRLVREWKRGTDLEKDSVTIYEGKQEDVSISGSRDQWVYHVGSTKKEVRPPRVYDWFHRAITFYTSENFIRKADGSTLKMKLPEDVDICTYFDFLLIELRKKWGTFEAGSLLIGSMDQIMKLSESGSEDDILKTLKALFSPSDTLSLNSYVCTQNCIVINATDALKPQLIVWQKPSVEGDAYKDLSGFKCVAGQQTQTNNGNGLAPSERDPNGPFNTISLRAVDTDRSDSIWVTSESFLSPSSLTYVDCALEIREDKLGVFLKSVPAFFDNKGMDTLQYWATSADGTEVPYFLVGKNLKDTSKPRPTLLYGYGGFEISFTPVYGAATGLAWLEKGGLFALGNIRGGGEFGPKWHQAALKEKRHKAYEDFEACAEDLIRRNLTEASLLSCMGGSNGGLLVGNMLTREKRSLFKAIVCQVPLLDMGRYHFLLAGASWMAEYGNPDKPEEWESIKTFSPFHLIDKNAENGKNQSRSYPRVLFDTSTKDDRVHPGHARKMVAKLEAETDCDVLYHENIEGGHAGAADNKQRAFMKTLEFLFLGQTLGVEVN